MRRLVKVVTVVAFVGARVALGQGGTIDTQCRAGSASERGTQDACQKTVDLFQFMAPQLGASLIGGNSVLGEGGSLGGFGHFSFGLRANAMRGRIPKVDAVTSATTGAVSTNFPLDEKLLGLPALDAAVGILPGVDLGDFTILGVDALVNIAFIPEVTSGDFSIRLPDGSVRLGFGARVSLLEESELTPAVSVSFLQRDLPTVDIRATPGNDELTISRMSLTSDAWRAVASKSIGPLTLAVGAGKDSYDASATVDVKVNGGGQFFQLSGFNVAQSLDRSTIFADLSLDFSLMKLVAEVGQVSGGTLATYNTFGDKRADDALQFASLGLRFRW